MSEYRTMELYLIQSPESVWQTDDNTRGYNRDLVRYYRKSGGIPIMDLQDFVNRVFSEVTGRKALIKKLVIGSHGSGDPTTRLGGVFYLGKNAVFHDSYQYLEILGTIKRFLVRDAAVYILACRTGNDTRVLQAVSRALGGVRVYGYTDYITSTSYGFLGVSVDDGTGDEGKEVVCWPTVCLTGAGQSGWSPHRR